MSLRFFSDQCVPSAISRALRTAGHEVVLLHEVMPIRSPDPAVIARAQQLGAVLLSLDGDFADIVAYPPVEYGGIVAIQLHNHPEILPDLVKRMLDLFSIYPEQEFYRGKLLVVEVHRVRVKQ